MVFVFAEGGILEVVGSAGEAERRYEGVDVESEVFIFFDENGAHLKPVFIKPNRGGRFLGLVGWMGSGEFRLVPSADAEHDLALLLFEAAELKPNPWFQSLAQVKDYLAPRIGSAETPAAGIDSGPRTVADAD